MDEVKDFDPVNDTKCPICGSSDIYCDLVQEETEDGKDIRYDIIYCPQCKKRLWEEDHD